MRILELILFLFALLTGALLMSPLIVEGDSRVPFLHIRWKGWASVRIGWADEAIHMRIRVLIFNLRLPRLAAKRGDRRPKPTIMRRPRDLKGKVFRLIRTFEVLQLKLSVDTSDAVINAWLYPLNFIGYPPGTSVHINFTHENYLVFRIKNRPWRLLRAWLQSSRHS
jgi:hypothetical protein